MKSVAKFFTLLLFSLSINSCDGKQNYDYSKAKQIQPVKVTPYASDFPPSAQDVEVVTSAAEGNNRRLTSLLNDKKAFPSSTDAEGNTPLMAAAKAGNEEGVKIILEHIDEKNRSTLNAGNSKGQTALHLAAESANPRIITALRKAGANPNVYDTDNNFPLYMAVRRNSPESVKAFLTIDSKLTPVNVDTPSIELKSSVHAAVENRNFEILKLLAEYHADFDQSDIRGYTPLIYAVMKDDKEMYDFLLANGANPNKMNSSEKTVLIYTIENEKHDLVKHILDKGGDPNIHAQGLSSPLQILVNRKNASPEMVQFLINRGAKLKDPKIPLGNVLARSINKGNAPAIAALIKNGAQVSDLETTYNNGIFDAFRVQDEEIGILMAENGANVNKKDESGFSPLAIAAKNNYRKLFHVLTQKGADVNQTSKNSAAVPLDIVINNNDAELLEIMFQNGLKAVPDAILLRAVTDNRGALVPVALKYGARPDIMNTLNQPALWLATSKGNFDSVQAIAEAGGSLEVKDSEKRLTPLSVALIKKDKDIANYLIDKGASPDNPDKNGITPLAYAAITGQDKLLQKLITKGGNVNATDNSGRTILKFLATSRLDKASMAKIKSILVAAGAQ